MKHCVHCVLLHVAVKYIHCWYCHRIWPWLSPSIVVVLPFFIWQLLLLWGVYNITALFLFYTAISVCFFYRKLERYTSYFKDLKGLRTLEWKTHLGLVQVSEISMIHIVHFDSDSNGTPHPAVPSVDIKLILYWMCLLWNHLTSVAANVFLDDKVYIV